MGVTTHAPGFATLLYHLLTSSGPSVGSEGELDWISEYESGTEFELNSVPIPAAYHGKQFSDFARDVAARLVLPQTPSGRGEPDDLCAICFTQPSTDGKTGVPTLRTRGKVQDGCLAVVLARNRLSSAVSAVSTQTNRAQAGGALPLLSCVV